MCGGMLFPGRNPVAVDLVAARLLGFNLEDVSYLKAAVKRGYKPACLEDVHLEGDLTRIKELDEQAKRIMPYDDEYVRWQDIHKELERLKSPIRFLWGPYSGGEHSSQCRTGCVMGLKMFLSFFERYAGPDAFARAKPVTFVVGRCDREIDAQGHEVFLIGSCANASIVNAKKITRMEKCFTTAGDMMQTISFKLGMPSPFLDPKFLFSYLGALVKASLRKLISLRYLQDMGHFMTKQLVRKV